MSEEKMDNGSNSDSSSTSQSTPNQAAPKADDGKLCAILSYLVIGIVWHFADENLKRNDFSKFHAKQALFLVIVSVLGSIILGLIPILGWLVLPLFSLATIVLAVVGIVNAANGDKKQLPVIGAHAEKYLKF